MTLSRLKILTLTQRSLPTEQSHASTSQFVMRIACSKSKYLEHFSRLGVQSEASFSRFVAFEFNSYFYHRYNLWSNENLFALVFCLSLGLTF